LTVWRRKPGEEGGFTTEHTESREREGRAKEKAPEEDRCREVGQAGWARFRNGTVDHGRGGGVPPVFAYVGETFHVLILKEY
jgi:hypothetical protein